MYFAAVYLTSILLFIVILENSCEQIKYGPIRVKLNSVDMCRGPKPRDCGAASVNTWIENEKILHAKVTVNRTIPRFQVRITGTLGNSNTPVQKMNMKSVCDNFAVKALFRVLLNVTDNCMITKGSYNNYIDLEDLTQTYLGGRFIYGNYTFKNIFFTEHCNHLCALVRMVFYPKNS